MPRLDPKWLLMRVKVRTEMRAARRLPVPEQGQRAQPQPAAKRERAA